MTDQVEIVGQALAYLKSMEAALRNGSATLPGSATTTRKSGLPGQSNKDPIKATAKSMDKLGEAADQASTRLGKLDRAVKLVTGSMGKMYGALGGRTGLKGTSKAAGVDATAMDTKQASKQMSSLGGGFDDLEGTAISLGSKFGNLVGITGSVYGAYKELAHLIEGPVFDVFNDAFKLQRRGISATENLIDFYLAAGKAGMSLDEYTKLIEENNNVVSRSKGFKDFNNKLETSTDALAGLGVFGAAARNVSATLLSSGTTLGIPQEQLGGVMQEQIKTFKHLRDVTGMTASGFQQLVAQFSSMDEVQSQLLGMAPAQRDAARKDLFASYTLGQSMGLTADQSKQLGDALLAQRKMTAVDRFQAAGAIRLAGGITGMGAQQTERLAELALKKNRTADENSEFVKIGGELQAGLEQQQNSGNIAAENITDQLEKIIPGGLGSQLKAAGAAKLSNDSGQVQKNFAASTGDFGQAVGKFVTGVEGMWKNPMWKALLEVGKIFGTFVAFEIAKKGVLSALSAGGGRGSKIAEALGSKSASNGIGSTLSNMIGGMKNPLQGLRDFATKDIGSLEGIGRGLGKGVGSILRGAKSLPGAVMAIGGSLGELAGDGITYMRTFKAIAQDGGFTTGELILQEGGAAIKGAVKMAGAGLEGLVGVVKGAGSFFKGVFGPELGFIFGAVEELFTGEMTKALDLGDGIFGRILGAVIAGFNGIFTSISGLFDSAVNWLMDGLGINFHVNITKFFDYVTSGIVDGWKMIGSILMKTLANIIEGVTSLFGLKAPFVKSLRDSADQIDTSIMKSSANREEMWNTEGATLKTIGAKQLAGEKQTADAVGAQVDRVTTAQAKTVEGMDNLVNSAVNTVNSAQAGIPAATVGTQVAMPTTPSGAIVTPPEVNKAQVEAAAAAAVKANPPPAPSVTTLADVIVILQQQLDIAKQQLSAMTGKKPEEPVTGPRAALPSTADMTNQFYANGSGMALGA